MYVYMYSRTGRFETTLALGVLEHPALRISVLNPYDGK